MAFQKHKSQPMDLQLLIDSVPALLHTGRPDGYLDFFNQRWLNFVGLTLKDLSGWKWTATIHPEDVAAIVEKWRAALATGEPFEHEARVRRADGEYRWMFHRKVPLRDMKGNIIKWYGSSIDIEDRKHAEESQRESDERFRTIFENAGLGTSLVDKQGHPIKCNPAIQKMLGYTEKELRSMAFTDFTHPDDKDLDWQLYTELVAGKRDKYEIEKRYIKKDGQLMWGHLTVSLVRAKDGAPGNYTVGMVKDITERKRSEEALRRNEDRLRHIIDTIPTMAWSVRPEGAVDFLNRRWIEYTGLSLEEYIEDPTRPIHPEDIPRVMEKWFAAMAVGEPYEDEMRLQRADGEYRWFLVRTVPLRDEMGNIVKWFGTSTEIEDRKRAEEALRASEERWRAVFENSAVGIALTSPQGMLLGTNRAYREMVGYTDEELRAMSYREVTYEEDREMNRALSNELWAGKRQQYQIEKRYRRKDGKLIWVRATVSAAPGPQGKPRFGMGIVEDITDRKRAEEALRRSEAYLNESQRLSHVGSWAWNVSTREIVFGSQENSRIFGFDPDKDEVTFQKALERLHTEDRPVFEQTLERNMSQPRDFELDFRLVLPSGSIRHIHSTGHPILDERGHLVEYICMHMDVTRRRRAEEALRKSEERWRSVFENSAIGVALTDLNGRFLAINPIYQKMVGYNEEELQVLSYLDITQEEYREANRKLTAELLEGKRQQFQIEKQYRRKDDDLIWVRNSVSLVPGTESVPQFIMALSEDITERKRAEEKLRRSEAYLASAQSLSHTGSWALDMSTGDLFWSKETFRIFGFDPAETTASIKDTFLQRIHPEDRSKIEDGLKAAAIEKGSYAVDYRIVLQDGSIKHIHDVVYPVVNHAGDVVERYGVIMDITERKRRERELQRSRDHLRALAARHQKVREEERTRVAREIHDELGQALTAIKMELSSLIYDMPTEKKEQSDSILKLVDETIQSVRRISTELRPAILDTLGLVAALEWAAEEFEARTGTKCHLDLPTDDLVIDPERATALFRIYQETLTNVARHANASLVDIRLAKEDGELSLEVRDNGDGTSEAQLTAGGSLGILGMRERALLLGGELIISGGPGKGTTVIVRIPGNPPTPPKVKK